MTNKFKQKVNEIKLIRLRLVCKVFIAMIYRNALRYMRQIFREIDLATSIGPSHRHQYMGALEYNCCNIPDDFNSFHPTDPFLFPRKTSENQSFYNVFRGSRKRPAAWNRLTEYVNPLITNPRKWSNIFKQFVGCYRRIVWVCLTILWCWLLKG